MLSARVAVRFGTAAVTAPVKAGLFAATAYLDVLAIAAWHRRPSATNAMGPEPAHRLAVLIPAHDEEKLVADAVASIVDQDYPDGLSSVHVVADNCTDATAAVAAGAGASVHVRTDASRRGKGPALRWLIAELEQQNMRPDAYVFIDADTVAEPGFLRNIDRALSRGAQVVQGHYAVRDTEGSPVVAFRAAALALRNYLRPLGRSAIGGSAGLYGNGMAFTSDVMSGRDWSDHLTEDAQLHLDLLLDGTMVSFAPDARVLAEMPDTLAAAASQNERWERGRLQLAGEYVPTLVRRVVSGGPVGRLAYADALFDTLIPPLSVVVGATGGWGVFALARAALVDRSVRRLWLVGAVIVGQAAAVLTALRSVGAPSAVYRSLLSAPRMIVWKVGLLGMVLTRRDRSKWVRTERN